MSPTDRPTAAVFRDWRKGEICIAYHPRLHPDLSTATVIEDFEAAPRRFFVNVRFHDESSNDFVQTHKQNVYSLADADRLHVNIDLDEAQAASARLIDLPKPGALVGQLVREVRTGEQMTIRDLARRAGVSAALISRIEDGDIGRVSRPTIEALARALGRHPLALLIVGSMIKQENARAQLLDLLRNAQHASASWDPAFFAGRVADLTPTPEALVEVARDLFPLVSDSDRPSEAYQEILGIAEPSPELNRVLSVWSDLTVQRRAKVADFTADQHTLSRLDRQNDAAA
jgi:transcriptional regulator with XRE-family HTH domain